MRRFIFTADDATSDTAIWASDGSAAGTTVILAGVQGSNVLNPATITPFGTKVAFVGKDSAGNIGLWVTNGTSAGTHELSTSVATVYSGGVYEGNIFGYGSKLLYSAWDGTNDGLFISDGSSSTEVLHIPLGSYAAYQDNFTAFGSKVLFNGSDSNGNTGLWVTDGTSAGTIELTSQAANYAIPIVAMFGNKAIFQLAGASGSTSLWATDGTVAGTMQIAAALVGSDPAYPYVVGVLNNRLLFSTKDANGMYGLWSSDGTAAGTMQIVSGNQGGNSFGPGALIPFGARALMTATGTAGGAGLWVTDGTGAGTTEIVRYSSPISLTIYQSAVLSGKVLYEAANFNDISGRGTFIGLQVSDGTTAGTKQLDANAANSFVIRLGSRVLYEHVDGSNDTGLAVSDGTTAGTVEIKAHLNPTGLTILGSRAVFAGKDPGDANVGLWITDGTAAGTIEIAAGTQGSANLNPQNLLVAGNRIFFTANDSSGNAGQWVTDGTASGTRELTARTPGGSAVSVLPSVSHDLNADAQSDILFRRTSDGLAYLFTMNDATVTSGATLSTQVSNNWQIKGIGDFDGNGTSDLLFVYNNAANPSDGLNGISYITLQNGPAATSGSNVVQQLGPEWSVQGVGDFDGDGKSDVLYRRSTDGALYLDAMNGASIDFSKSGFLSQQISDLHWQVAGIGDFDGDGHADILWRYDNPSNPSDGLNGVVYEWLMNGTGVVGQGLISSQPGSDKWQVAGTGDFNGNGTADILFRYENAANAGDALNGFTYLDLMNGTNVSSSSAPTQWQVDNSWSVASIGDYNGDGKSDILFQHAGDGATYIWDMNGVATTSGNFTSMQSGPGWTVQNGALIG